MNFEVTPDSAPALGDIRTAGNGDWIFVSSRATERDDWSRYWEAIGVAFVRGARVAELWEW